MDLETKRQTLEALKTQVHTLESEIRAAEAEEWRATAFYPAYHATTGFLLGVFGATTSLLFNVVGSAATGKNPLELVRIYLTFPLGAQALQLSEGGGNLYAIDDGVILAIGCCLYLLTGMLLGIPMAVALAWFSPRGSLRKRLLIATLLSLALWIAGFYGVLSWLQPALFGGRWIVEMIPWWVAASTHLVFGWTVALAYPLAQYEPYRRPTAVA